jgi:hypothetical protein
MQYNLHRDNILLLSPPPPRILFICRAYYWAVLMLVLWLWQCWKEGSVYLPSVFEVLVNIMCQCLKPHKSF